MKEFLEELYKTDISLSGYVGRKVYLDEESYQITGVTQCGKTYLIKHYLLSLKKSKYLYIDLIDTRIEMDQLNETLNEFCIDHKIETIAIENFTNELILPNVSQIIISSELFFDVENLIHIELDLLDFEEFLAYEHKYDSSALNHFFQLGSFCAMHKIAPSERALYIQKILKFALNEIEFEIIKLIAQSYRQKISPFSLYDELKQKRKISKDKLYEAFSALLKKRYIYKVPKYNYEKATSKIYLCDTAMKNALSTKRHFGNLFENTIFLELVKHENSIYYADGIDFYLPQLNKIVLSMPFASERTLFKKLESIEAFIFGYQVTLIEAVTMNSEGSISHPIAKVNMTPFSMWALGD